VGAVRTATSGGFELGFGVRLGGFGLDALGDGLGASCFDRSADYVYVGAYYGVLGFGIEGAR
jgi:hypothetical protein